MVELRGLEPLTPTPPAWGAAACAVVPDTASAPYGCGTDVIRSEWKSVRVPDRPGNVLVEVRAAVEWSLR